MFGGFSKDFFHLPPTTPGFSTLVRSTASDNRNVAKEASRMLVYANAAHSDSRFEVTGINRRRVTTLGEQIVTPGAKKRLTGQVQLWVNCHPIDLELSLFVDEKEVSHIERLLGSIKEGLSERLEDLLIDRIGGKLDMWIHQKFQSNTKNDNWIAVGNHNIAKNKRETRLKTSRWLGATGSNSRVWAGGLGQDRQSKSIVGKRSSDMGMLARSAQFVRSPVAKTLIRAGSLATRIYQASDQQAIIRVGVPIVAGVGGRYVGGAVAGTLVGGPGWGTAIGAFVGGIGGDVVGDFLVDWYFQSNAEKIEQEQRDRYLQYLIEHYSSN